MTYRLRRDTYTDTPLPPEEPVGENPPDGAVIDYTLAAGTSGPVAIAIYDSNGKLVRRYASTDKPEPIDPEITVPTYWVRPTAIPATGVGMHRFVWDLHYPHPDAFTYGYPISAIVHDTPRIPQGVLAMPGRYTVRLTAGGRSYSQPLTIVMDPRVTLARAAFEEQFTLGSRIVAAMNRSFTLANRAKTQHHAAAQKRYEGLNDALSQLLGVVEDADAAPTEQAGATVSALLHGVGP